MDHRPISPIEMYSVGRNQLDFYKTVLSYIRMEIFSDVYPFSQWILTIEKALRLTIDAQPRLRLQVDLTRTIPYFVILPIENFEQLPIEIVERDENDQDEIFLDKILEKQTNLGFIYNNNLPLWRLIFIFSSKDNIFDIIFTFNHAIGDGISGMAFFQTFLRFLSNQSTKKYSLENDFSCHQMIPSKLPSLFSLIPQMFEKLLLPNVLSRYLFPKTYWSGFQQLIGNEQYPTRLISMKFSRTDLHSLHRKCQHEQTTIHCAILSSIILSLNEIIEKINLEFSCGSAVNIRRYCHPIVSNEQMGVFVSSANSHHYLSSKQNSNDLFWPLARQIKEQITFEIEHNILPKLQSLKLVSNWLDFFSKQRQTLPNGHSLSLDISNLLQWTFDDCLSSSWKILHGGFTQSANVVGSPLMISIVTVNEILQIYISFFHIQQDIVLRNRIKQLLINAI